MKVCYILHSTLLRGGATKSFLSMLKGVMQLGVTPIVVVPDQNGVYQTLKALGVSTYVINHRMHIYPYIRAAKDVILWLPRLIYWIFLNRMAERELTAIVKQERPDIIHSNTSVINFGYDVARKLNIPHVYHFREYGDLDFNFHYIPSRSSLLKRIQWPGNTSVFITKDICHHFGQDNAANARVVYNPICSSIVDHHHHSDGRFFLFAGRIEPGKGVDLLLRAYADYAKQSLQPLTLKIAGLFQNLIYKQKLDEFISEQQLQAHIFFLGEIDHVDQLMQHATAIVIPSVKEGFGRVMPEAMTHGCPVIARNTGGTNEQLDNGLELTGREIAFRFNTEEELTHLLVQVADAESNTFEIMTADAAYTVAQLYSFDVHYKNIYNIYKQIVN